MDGNLQDSLTSLVSQFEKGAAKYANIATGVDTDLAFNTSTWYGKILSIPVDDAVREWRSWMASAQEVEDLERAEAELQYRAVIREAMLIARHRGGGVIIPIGLPGSPSSKLNVDQIKRGSITRLVNLTRDQITPGPVDRDPMSETFCMPEYWTINQVRFHPSRVILVNGRRAPGSSLLASEIWGNSIWVHLRQAIESADSLPYQLSSLLDEAKLDVVTIPDLAALLSTREGEDALLRRWTAVARLKQIGNISLIDGGPVKEGTKTEGWDQKQLTWSGLSDVAKTVLLLMAGASDIPMTRLSGEQQSGLSGADAGSLRNYYDAVSSTQKLILQPQIAPLDEMLIRNALGKRPETVWYRWNTLFQVDDLTAAQVDKLMAETSALYASNALVPTEALEKATHNRMIETDRWPGLEKALEEVPEAERYGENGEGETDPTIAETHSERLETQSMDAAPRTLYVHRKVLNADQILDWARSQGFESTLPAEDLHVTVVFSREPVDWMRVGQAWESKIEIPEGGPRLIETFGEAKVLLFSSVELQWRHLMAKEAGASWDHPEYQPHITLTYGSLPENVEPYQGPIVLGPEIFQEVKEDWAESIEEV